MKSRTWLWLALLAFAAGCEGEQAQEARREAARVSRAVDVLRGAPNPEKAPRLVALRAVECTAPDVCEVKEACVRAYERHLAAVEGSRAARRAVTADAALDQDAAGAAAELTTRSQAELEKGKELNRRCLALQGALRRRHRL
jgi:hypothetical protein